MNFFEHQDRAKRKTTQLILLLALAVLSLILITGLMLALFFYYFEAHNPPYIYTQNHPGFWQGLWHSMPPQAFVWIGLGISGVVGLGSLFRYGQLQSGGSSVAMAMGGQRISGQTQDTDERKILNIVEEIAIASGTAVPPVYLIEEDSINAFAAGFKPQDAVIGITRGCIQRLSRDELQGVIAHEFSHIFHGDMRLNMRLVAILYGILVIGLIGEFLLRSNRYRSYNSRDKSRGGIMLLGLGLFVIGYAGTFFGNLIKAAVSRQREFLADASAVQFTRNPGGIAGALKKIGGNPQGSQLHNPNAAQFSHMYFSQGIANFLNLMATHPPLAERIRRIEPRWNGSFATDSPEVLHQSTAPSTGAAGFNALNTSALALDIDAQLENIAHPQAVHLDYARAQLDEMPAHIKEATATPTDAQALILGLLLDSDVNARDQQWRCLSQHLKPAEFNQLRPLAGAAAELPLSQRLPLIELCLTTLKQLSSEQINLLLRLAGALIKADNKISLREWSLYRILRHNLQPNRDTQRQLTLTQLASECQLLLSLLAQAGANNSAAAQQAMAKAQLELGKIPLSLLPKEQINLALADVALEKLNQLKPLQKPLLLKAMSQCALDDGKLSLLEAEIFRAIADSLDCPMPPLIPISYN